MNGCLGRRCPPRRLAGIAASIALMAAAGCGQWSSAPVAEAPVAPVPLGPGPLVAVATGTSSTALAVHAHGRVVAVAWASTGPVAGGIGAGVATSPDAGATIEDARFLGTVDGGGEGESHRIEVGVAGPDRAERAAGPGAQIWVRLVAARAAGGAWRSRDAGKTFEPLPATSLPARVLPDPWIASAAGASHAGVVALRPPGALMAAGVQHVDRPALALPSVQPAAVVDDHGALALVWTEAAATSTNADLVLRRAWVDWNGQSSRAAPFDAPVVVAHGVAPDTRAGLARVPGGVVAVWAARDATGRSSVMMRRVGLDMTCTRESATAVPQATQP